MITIKRERRRRREGEMEGEGGKREEGGKSILMYSVLLKSVYILIHRLLVKDIFFINNQFNKVMKIKSYRQNLFEYYTCLRESVI